jgi:hypothetical protein
MIMPIFPVSAGVDPVRVPDTRVVRRKQSAFANALAVSRRAIQLSMDRLSAYGYVAPLKNTASGSRAYVNAFEIAPKANLCSHYKANPRSYFGKRSEPRIKKMRT